MLGKKQNIGYWAIPQCGTFKVCNYSIASFDEEKNHKTRHLENTRISHRRDSVSEILPKRGFSGGSLLRTKGGCSKRKAADTSPVPWYAWAESGFRRKMHASMHIENICLGRTCVFPRHFVGCVDW